MKAEERIRCPVHDLISFKRQRSEDVVLWGLLQTPAIQRLRRVKQLGFSEFVYPGATHTRLSHVLGAMQMARRMLDVLQKNNAFGEVPDFEIQRSATLAAALLHDVGHGPYSHVFEEVCETLGIEKKHEAYTLEFIDSEQIRPLLERGGIFAETRRFFTEEPGQAVFNSIISSQLDCDRLDFLVRDRHHTGIRAANIDLAWLFDSLNIEKVAIDDDGAFEYSFVFSAKGQAVAEEFVLAYIKMYNSVYFHKTTRGVQHLVRDMLVEVINQHSERAELRSLPLVKFFKEDQSLDRYARLDDGSVLAIAHVVAEVDLGLASELARRFLNRDTYKCFELPGTATGNIGRNKLLRFRDALHNDSIYFVEDKLAHRNYKQHAVTDESFLKNILIKINGEHESLGSVSSLLKTPVTRVARFYFRTREDCERAQRIFHEL
nr:HD domain-containing protein [Bradyrhizobium acaciae]